MCNLELSSADINSRLLHQIIYDSDFNWNIFPPFYDDAVPAFTVNKHTMITDQK